MPPDSVPAERLVNDVLYISILTVLPFNASSVPELVTVALWKKSVVPLLARIVPMLEAVPPESASIVMLASVASISPLFTKLR